MFVTGGEVSKRSAVDLSVNVPPPMFADRPLVPTFQALARDMDAEAFACDRSTPSSPEHRRPIAPRLTEHCIEVSPDRRPFANGARRAQESAP
jgi:hypothetical protein